MDGILMPSLRWIADGIETAERAGGVTLDKVRRTGFTRGTSVRERSAGGVSASGFEVGDPEPDEYGEDD